MTIGIPTKPKYKSVPEDWRAIPGNRFTEAIGHIESVLLGISTDGKLDANPFECVPTLPTLNRWAEHLRRALKELTK